MLHTPLQGLTEELEHSMVLVTFQKSNYIPLQNQGKRIKTITGTQNNFTTDL